jgi:hypothetical protein
MIPVITGVEKVPDARRVSTPTVRLRPVAKLCANAFGWKSSRSAARITRCRVSSEIRPVPFNTRDTVDTDTPATAATSLIVT